MQAMVATGLACPEHYRVEPFRIYWKDEIYPPTLKCLRLFGYGSQYFQSNPMPESLSRLYQLDQAGFDSTCFCDFCPLNRLCGTRVDEVPVLELAILAGW